MTGEKPETYGGRDSRFCHAPSGRCYQMRDCYAAKECQHELADPMPCGCPPGPCVHADDEGVDNG